MWNVARNVFQEGVQIRSDLKILDATRLKLSTFHTDNPQILSCNRTNFNRHAYMAPGIVHPWSIITLACIPTFPITTFWPKGTAFGKMDLLPSSSIEQKLL
jgi:hypothetical protein